MHSRPQSHSAEFLTNDGLWGRESETSRSFCTCAVDATKYTKMRDVRAKFSGFAHYS